MTQSPYLGFLLDMNISTVRYLLVRSWLELKGMLRMAVSDERARPAMSRLRPYKVQPCGKLHPLDKRSSVITVYFQICVASYPAYLLDRLI